MIELCCEHLSERWIWLYVLVMSRTHFRVNPHSIFAWMSRNSLLKTGATSDMTRTYSQMHRTDKYSRQSSIISSVSPNGWVFVYEPSGCGFEFSCRCWFSLSTGIQIQHSAGTHYPGNISSNTTPSRHAISREYLLSDLRNYGTC